jgi:hypothetical protein
LLCVNQNGGKERLGREIVGHGQEKEDAKLAVSKPSEKVTSGYIGTIEDR